MAKSGAGDGDGGVEWEGWAGDDCGDPGHPLLFDEASVRLASVPAGLS